MRKVFVTIGLLVALATGMTVAGSLAAPPPSNPGSPGDNCSHGNSGKPCKPDPQPEHGKDCEDHGKARGNEDHCDGTTTPPPTDPPVVTTVPVGETTTVTVPAEPGDKVTVTTPDGTTTIPVTPRKPPVVKVTPTKPGVTIIRVSGKTVKAIGSPIPGAKPLAG